MNRYLWVACVVLSAVTLLAYALYRITEPDPPGSARARDAKVFCEERMTMECALKASNYVNAPVAWFDQIRGFTFVGVSSSRPGLVVQSWYSRRHLLEIYSGITHEGDPATSTRADDILEVRTYSIPSVGSLWIDWSKNGQDFRIDVLSRNGDSVKVDPFLKLVSSGSLAHPRQS